jgi:hypothetical protein
MNKKTRYLLILVGFTIFILLAPLIVLYTRGLTFDIKTRRFVPTGILAIRTEPKSVKVLIDGQVALNKNGDIKFLLPKEYNIIIRKDGYFDWAKRLPVLANQVTWASPAPNKLFLFLSNPSAQTLSSRVADFYADNNSLVYLSGDSIVVSSANNPSQSENFTLPKAVNHILASPNGQYFALTNTAATISPATILVFDKNSHSFTDLTGLFNAPADLEFSFGNQLYALSNQTLYLINLQLKNKSPVQTQVLGFTFRENDLYFLAGTSTNASLLVSSPPQASGTLILNNIAGASGGKIFVNFEKQILLILDGRLYQVGSRLENLAGNIGMWNFNYGQSSLIFTHEGELSYYDPFVHNVRFITRSSENIIAPILSPDSDNTFFIKNNNLEVLELDNRDHQNNYILYHGQNLEKFLLTADITNAYVLDNGELKVLKIR